MTKTSQEILAIQTDLQWWVHAQTLLRDFPYFSAMFCWGFFNKRIFLQVHGWGFFFCFGGCLVCLLVWFLFIFNRLQPWQSLVFLLFFYTYIFQACHQTSSERMGHSIHSAAYSGLSYSLKKN